jgi:hypothetical protein
VVHERIAKVVGKLTVPRDIVIWHPAIDLLLKEDDKRREKQLAAHYPMSWDNPLFDAPIERRRLRILKAISRRLRFKLSWPLSSSTVKALSAGINGVWNGRPNLERKKENGSSKPGARNANDRNISNGYGSNACLRMMQHFSKPEQ